MLRLVLSMGEFGISATRIDSRRALVSDMVECMELYCWDVVLKRSRGRMVVVVVVIGSERMAGDRKRRSRSVVAKRKGVSIDDRLLLLLLTILPSLICVYLYGDVIIHNSSWRVENNWLCLC